jgi:hypothetical protein
MSLFSDMEQRANAAQLRTFGEPVTLPDGLTVVQGIFAPLGEPLTAPWPELGLSVRPSQQPNPVLYLTPGDASGLIAPSGDAPTLQTLTIRAVAYRIADIAPEDGGLIRLALAPDTATEDTDPEARWQ